ncbi:MAG: extracellular solute-binding protein [Chloroflexota bacterium]
MKVKRFVIYVALLALVLGGCAQPTPTKPAPIKAQPTATVAPTEVPPTATVAPTEVPPTATPVPAERTKVQVISWWDFTTSASLQGLKEAFEKENPDLELEYIQVGKGYADKVLTMIAGGGDLPDVMMLAMDKVPMFADRGAILNLDEYMTAEYKNDLYPVVLQALTYNGSVFAVARDVSSRVMFLNKAMFDERGVAYPDPNWTWEDFREIARQLTKVDASDQPIQWGFYFPKYNDGFFHWLRQSNGGLVSEDGTRSLLGTPESIEALHFLQDLIIKDKVCPTESQAKQYGTSDSAPFIAGKVAMVAGSLSTSVALTNNNVEYVVRPLPTGKRKMNTAFVNSWTIPKGAKNPRLSWRVLEFFSGKGGQQIVLNTGMGLPASKGVDTTAFLQAHPDNHFLMEAMDYAEPFPCPLHGVDFFRLVTQEFDLMWLGERSVEDAVAAVEATGNDILAGK